MDYIFPVTKTETPKAKPDMAHLHFGKDFTDHMFIMEYDEGQGWHDGRVVPYQNISLSPAAAVLHYAQMIFEGMKAYKAADGSVRLFRPYENAARINQSAQRMCIPEMDEDLYVSAVKAVVKTDADWIPEGQGNSLYIRPFIIASEAFVGVKVAKHYLFIIILSPSGAYYAAEGGGLSTTKIYVEDDLIRAAKGGTGFAKCGGNYAGGMKASEKAAAAGCRDVLWLDAKEHKYVEEVGTSNAFFKIDGEVITAPLGGTILPGITRKSVIALLQSWGVPVSERRLSIDEIYEAAAAGKLEEVFATGTAAVISPIGLLSYQGKEISINNNQVGATAQKLFDTIFGIQTGKLDDPFGWSMKI